MNTPDLTQLILESTVWLSLGLFLYYIITFIKVHLIWRIQPRVWDSNFSKNIFKSYMPFLIKSMSIDFNLHKAVFKYIFNYNKKDFLVSEIEKVEFIKKRLSILDSLTTFLKPFIFFAIFFTFLRLWISTHFLYNELSITLKEIQVILTYLQSFSFVIWFNNNNYLIYFILGLIGVFIPFLLNKNSIKKLKYAVVCFSILFNVSFFGTSTEKTLGKKTDSLLDLSLEITSIHDSIFKETLKIGVISEIEKELKKEQESYTKEYNRFNNKIKSVKNFPKDSLIRKQLNVNLLKKLSELGKLVYKIEDFNFSEKKQQKAKTKEFYQEFKNFYEENYKEENYKNNSSYKEYASYLNNKEKWNKKDGKSILEKVKKLTRNKKQGAFYKKLEEILGLVFDYSLNTLSSGIFNIDELNISSQKTLKKIINITSNSLFRDGAIKKTIDILNSIANTSKTKEILNNNRDLYLFEEEKFNKRVKSNSTFFNNEKRKAREKQRKIDKEKQQKLDRKKAVNRLTKKVNTTINDLVFKINRNNIFGNQISYDKKEQIIQEYFKEIDFNKMPINEINKITSSAILIKNKIEQILRSNKISSLHPGLKETCPICNYYKSKATLNIFK